MPFQTGREYSRREIHEIVGGSIQSFLPHAAGRIVAACLDQSLNPSAPHQILAGDSPGVVAAARLLTGQRDPIPVFLKRGAARWEFVGTFAVRKWTDDPVECAAAARLGHRADRLRLVIELERRGP